MDGFERFTGEGRRNDRFKSEVMFSSFFRFNNPTKYDESVGDEERDKFWSKRRAFMICDLGGATSKMRYRWARF